MISNPLIYTAVSLYFSSRFILTDTMPESKQIFVGGLPPSATEDTVKTYFQQYGSVVDVQVDYVGLHLPQFFLLN